MAFIEANNISKAYVDTANPVWVFKGLDFKVERSELVGIFGASGAGKSTFLHIIGGLDEATEGNVLIDGVRIDKMKNDEIAKFRNKKLGFVFQFYHLLAEFSAVENVMLPALIAGFSRFKAMDAAKEVLAVMGLSERFFHRPAMLSGGEQQRVAIARAFILKPSIILADEPTGNLDHQNGELVFDCLLNLNKSFSTTMIIVTHNRELLVRLPKTYELADGVLEEIGKDSTSA